MDQTLPRYLFLLDIVLMENLTRSCYCWSWMMEGTCPGEDIFTKPDDKLKEEGLSWDECIGVCADAAAAMLGEVKRSYI